MSKNLFLFARICCVATLMFACDDDDKKHDNDEGGTPAGAQGGTPAGAQGGTPAGSEGGTPAGSEGGTPAGAQGGTPAGAQGGTPAGSEGGTPAGSEGGTPAGAQGGTPAGAQGGTPAGNPNPNMVCQEACNALGDCAVSVCAGYEEADKQRVVDGCVTTCQGAPGLAALFNQQETCEDKVAFASNANPDFAAACMGTPAGMTGGTPAGSEGGTPAGSEGGTPAGSEGGTTGGTPAGMTGGTTGGTTGGMTGGTTGGMTGGMMGSDLPAPVNQSGTIAVGSEATYRFETTSEVVASVSTFGCDDPTSDAYDTDTKVYIYPVVDGVRGDTAIASNDDISYSGGNTCSAFIVQLPVGSYEIVVEDYSRNDEIQYNLSVVFYQAAVTGDVCNDQSICVDDNTDCFDGVCSSNIANVGEACNDRLFCVAGAGCLDNVCVDGSPTVLSVNAFSRLNGADTIVSFQFEASDPDLNVDSFSSIRLLDDQGVELYTRSFGFFGSQSTATFTDTYQFTVFGQNLSPKSIEMIIEDNDGNASDAFVADVQAYPTNLPVGASCLDNAYTGICDTGLACFAGSCIVPAPECPMDYQTMSLTELRTGFWSYQGDNTNTPNRAVATCASSINEDVIAWHAMPGTYTITATPVEPNDDLVLFARSYCGFADARFELGCQDEGGGGDLETITLTVDTEQTVYLFVGGWNSGDEGSYRLDVIDQAAQMTNLQIGDMCDAYATCATGLSCMVGTCVLPSAECPAAYDVKMLTESNGVWTYAGNTTTAANISSASCATSETEDVISATLTAGKYAVELNVIDQADMVLFARTVCSINDPQFELGCKDGAGRGNDEATTIELLADDTVYFYVGAYGASDVGAYELTVRPIVENLASGDACDAYRICGTGLTCMNDVCVSSVPMVNSASAYFAGYENNLSTLFITINGMDNDMDSSYADIKVWDSSDNVIDSKLGVFVGFTSDATFSYTYSLTSDLDLTNAAKVSIELIDDMDQRSNTYIQDVLPLPILNAGDACNPSSDALGRCDVGLYCIENVCADPANYATCPGTWVVYDAVVAQQANTWEYVGTTVDTSNDLMTCKSYATGYEDAIKFDAPAAGTYVIELLSDFDGILGVREYCNLNVSSFDLACIDDVSELDIETKTITVDAAKSIYIFVDSYKFGSPTFGSYIVTITQQ